MGGIRMNTSPSPQTDCRLIASRTIEAIESSDEHPNALLWNPAGLSLEEAADMLGISQGKAAILGGPEIYRLFLPRFTFFTFLG